MGDKLVSGSELARVVGVTKQSISKKVKSGILIPDAYTDSGRPQFYLEKNKKLLQDMSAINNEQSHHDGLPKSLKGGRPVVDKSNDKKIVITDDENVNLHSDSNAAYLKARADKMVYQAKMAELEYEKQKGEVQSIADVQQQGSELATILVTALTNLPDRLSSELSTMDDQYEIHDLLTREINLMIKDIQEKLGHYEAENE